MTIALIATLAGVWLIEWFSSLVGKMRTTTPSNSLLLSFGSRLVMFTILFGGLHFSGLVDLAILGPGRWDDTVRGLAWMGISETETWVDAFWGVLPVITIVTGLTIYLPNRKQMDFRRLSPATGVAVILIAALNAWIEELSFRAIPLTFFAVPRNWAIWISALAFGLPHYFGFPSRFLGIALATFLGWFLATMVAQTGGLLGAFLIHWTQDIVIMLLLSIATTPSLFKSLGEQPVRSMAGCFALGMIWLATFQFGLVCGAPWGAAAWGGRFSGTLPASMRIASAITIGVYVLFALIILARAGSIRLPLSERAARNWAIGISALLCISAVLNLTSPSSAERWLMGPIAISLATAAIAVTRSRRRDPL